MMAGALPLPAQSGAEQTGGVLVETNNIIIKANISPGPLPR